MIRMLLVIALVCVGMTIDNKLQSEEKAQLIVHPSAKEKKLAAIFEDHGSPAPMDMAKAVLNTKRPVVLAAIAIQESNADPKAVGDNGASHGAFQVQKQHWGRVSSDPADQAQQAERILDELVDHEPRGSLCRRTLAKYNGGTRPPRAAYKYADKVMKLTRDIKREMQV